MTDLALGTGVVVFATDDINRMLETAKVYEPHPESEEDGPYNQPSDNQGDFCA